MDITKEISSQLADNATWTYHPWDVTVADLTMVPATTLSPNQLHMYKIGHDIKAYLQPIIIIMGLVCNTLSFMVMVLPHNRRIPCCLYLAALAVSDNIMLLVNGYYVLQTGLREVLMKKVECMLIVYGYMSTSVYGVFVILAMTIDRFLATHYPLQKAIWCTMKRAQITLGLLILIISIYTLPYLFYSRPACYDQLCGPLAQKNNNFVLAYSIFSFCLSCVIPFTLLIILNSCIINTIRKRNQILVNPSITGSDSEASITSLLNRPNAQYGGIRHNSRSSIVSRSLSDESVRERQLTTMLITVSFALLILTAPQYIHHLIYRLIDIRTDYDIYGTYILINAFTDTPFYLNNAINFWLYGISGSKFRQDFISLFRCKRLESEIQ